MMLDYTIEDYRGASMPGVYVGGRGSNTREYAKIDALGLRIANDATYHGLALNVDMDLEPFARINPCGYEGLAVTQMCNFGVTDTMDIIGGRLVEHLTRQLYREDKGKHHG